MSYAEYRQPSKHEQIEQRIEKTCRQVKSMEIFLTLTVLITCGLGYLIVFTLLDHWGFQGGVPGKLRFAFFVGGLIAAGLYIVCRFLPLILYSVNPVYAAKILEEHRPSMKNSLINWIFLRKDADQSQSGTSPVTPQNLFHNRMIEGVATQTANDLEYVPSEMVVDHSPIIRWGFVLLGFVVFFAVYFLFSPKNPLPSFARLMFPFSRISAPTRVQFVEVKPGDATVAQGDVVTVSAHITGAKKNVPVYLYYTTDDQRVVDQIVPMTVPEGDYRFECRFPPGKSGFEQGTSYHIGVGTEKSRVFRFDTQQPFLLEVRSLTYKYPAYTGVADAVVQGTGDIRAVEGSQVVINAKSNFPLKNGSFIPNGEDKDAKSLSVTSSDPMSANIAIWLAASAVNPAKAEYQSYVLRGYDAENNTNRNPSVYRVEMLKDKPPTISWINPPEDQLTIPQNGYTEALVSAEDADFGIRNIRFHFESEKQKIAPVELLKAPSSGPTEFTGKVNRSYKIEPDKLRLSVGDVVEYWAEAIDTKLPQGNSALSRRLSFVVAPPKPGADQKDANQERQEQKEKEDQEQKEKEQQAKEQQEQKDKEQQQDEQDKGQEDDSKAQDTDDSENSGQTDSSDDKQSENKTGEDGTNENSKDESKSGKDGENGDEKTESQNGEPQNEQQNQQGHQDGEQEQQKGQQGDQGGQQGGGGQEQGAQNDQSGNEKSDAGSDSGQGGQGGQGGQQNGQQGGDKQQGDGGQSQKSDEQSGFQPTGDSNGEGTPDDGQTSGQPGQKGNQQGNKGGQQQDQPQNKQGAGNPNEEKSANGGNSNQPQQPLDGESQPGEVFEKVLDRMKKEGKETDPNKDDPNKSGPRQHSDDLDPESDQRTDQGTAPKDVPQKSAERKPGEQTQKAYKTADDQNADPKEKADPSKPVMNDSKNPGAGKPSDEPGEESGLPGGQNGEQQPGGEEQGEGGQQQPGAGKEQPDGQQKPGAGGQQQQQQQKQPGDGGEPGGGGEQQPGDGEQGESGAGGEQQSGNENASPGEGTSAGEGNSKQQQRGGGTGNQNQGDFMSDPTVQYDPNLDYTEKQTSLVLKYLEEEMAKSEPNPELLKDLGWSQGDLKAFLEKWKTMADGAEKAAPGTRDDQSWKEALKSLGTIVPGRSTTAKARTRHQDQATATGALRVQPPKNLKERFERYNQEISK